MRLIRLLLAALCGIVVATGCSSSDLDQASEPEKIGSASFALTSSQLSDLLGFEDRSLWSSTSTNLVLRQMDTAVQGRYSMGIREQGFHFINSVPLTGFPLQNNVVNLSVRLPENQPNSYWYGDIQMYVNAPSVGLYEQYVGYVGLTGLPLGQWQTITLTLPDNIYNALKAGTFNDLVIRLTANIPFGNTDTWLLDNLVFGGVSATQLNETLIGNIFQQGMRVDFTRINTDLDLPNAVGLAACDPYALYAVQNDNGLWFSNDGGRTWAIRGLAFSSEIACDHGMLMTLDSLGRAYYAFMRTDGFVTDSSGQVGVWTQVSQSVTVDRIQGGDGTFYGVKSGASGNQVYWATNLAWRQVPSWRSTLATIGATLVTGTGAKATGGKVGVAEKDPGGGLPWPRRAFALEENGLLSYNDQLLSGGNLWTGLNTGSERYTVVTAAAPNLLYGLQTRNGVVELDRISMTETNCTDDTDNDGNGRFDGEDPACMQILADSYCSARSDGTYCSARFQDSPFLGQPNQNASLVTCSGGVASRIDSGVCVYNPNPAITNADSLATLESLNIPEPAGYGHWCNVHYSDGSWDLNWSGSTPCQAFPGIKIVRAGIYSLNGFNRVLVNCTNGHTEAATFGTAPIEAAYNTVGHTQNRCLFMISPAELPVFNRLMRVNPSDQVPGLGTNSFNHLLAGPEVDITPFLPSCNDPGAMDLEPTPNDGDPCTASANGFGIDTYGTSAGNHPGAYDHNLYAGSPLFAVADGVVVENGSRLRDISGLSVTGTPNQTEILIKHVVGSDPTYQESFVMAYAHMRARLVESGQTVKAGQLIGFVGSVGASTGAHVHHGVLRLSNVNAYIPGTPGDYALGYHFPLEVNDDQNYGRVALSLSIDGLGWNAAPLDPWGYQYRDTPVSTSTIAFTGRGAWSIDLFKPGEEFPYP